MPESNRLQLPSAASVERWPWVVRGLLGCAAAALAAALTHFVEPLRPFPLLLAFPTVILVSWFLGMWGGVLCALSCAVAVHFFFTRPLIQFSIESAREEMRLALFLFLSIFVGWAIRRLAQQRAELATSQLEQRLLLADARRQLAEERAAAGAALRDRDEMLQIALRANGMGLWVWDMQKGLVHRSDEMFRMLGREPGSFGDEPEEWLQFVHPDDRESLAQQVEALRKSGRDYHRQYRVIWPDGAVRWLESQGKCQRDAEGKVVRIVGVMSDVTHRKVAEEAMLRAEKLAVAGKLAASVAHEINNPLAAVANLLYLVSIAETADHARTFADKALDELMRVSLITQQTLKFHRQTGAPRETRLSEAVESVLALFRGKLQAAKIDVDLQVEKERTIPCMPGEMQQIFANLLSNAIEAMPRGGRLAIRLRPSADWRDRTARGMRATFRDTGMGMDRATLRRVFEPFFTTKPDTGTGLGMWVVAQLVERHNGHVRGWSGPASGTAFSVFLPFVDAARNLDRPEIQLETEQAISAEC
jgi:PAS domain S-box-containing protein